jgi:hypothetical protein
MYWDKIVPQCKNMGWLAIGLVSLVIVIMMILFLFLWLVGLVFGLLGGASKSGYIDKKGTPGVHLSDRILYVLGFDKKGRQLVLHGLKKKYGDQE